ncbi:MAG: PEP-CTERM sorting domain-containing protein [Armatimonadetes bacterium]|nr:PEP-CTERM sorting domain-containing protein [Armatimonadota bacterium]
MIKKYVWLVHLLCLGFLLVVYSADPALAQSADNWNIGLSTIGNGSAMGSLIGIAPWAHDGYDGGTGMYINPSYKVIILDYYKEYGPDWDGPSGFYGGDFEKTPIAAGESRTWSGFYLWAQNITPTTANRVAIYSPNDPYLPPPAGYMGHLVLDYVPESCNYTGSMDFWLDLTVRTDLSLPIPVVTDPLQGTRFHMTVFAPVPEPSSLAVLGMGIAPLAMFGFRKRRW